MHVNRKNLIVILVIMMYSIAIASDFPFKGEWQFQERGGSGGKVVTHDIYYPNELDVFSPAVYVNQYSCNQLMMDNIKNKVGVIPNVIIWENDSTQTLQFNLFHAYLDSSVDTTFSWSDFRDYLFFKIESIDKKVKFYHPYTQGDPKKNLVLRNTKEIANYFYYSYNQLQVPFSRNEAFIVTLQFFELPDTNSTVYHSFAPHIVVKFLPETSADSLVWATSTNQWKHNPDKISLYKSIANGMPNSIFAQKAYMYCLKKQDRKEKYFYIMNLLENKVDSTKPVSYPIHDSNGGFINNEQQYFASNFYNMLAMYKSYYSVPLPPFLQKLSAK